MKIPQIDFAVRSGGTLSVRIPVGKLKLIVAGHPIFAVSLFQLDIAQGNFSFSADLDLLCEWLAPSIKKHPIGFRLSLGIAADSSLIISIYSVNPLTGQVYPDMSKNLFIVRPFYIPGLILYPFHFSMRWLAEAEMSEAFAAGGGFGIQGTQIANVYVWTLFQAKLCTILIHSGSHFLWISDIPRRIISILISKKVSPRNSCF